MARAVLAAAISSGCTLPRDDTPLALDGAVDAHPSVDGPGPADAPTPPPATDAPQGCDPLTACGDQCVDLRTSVRHCGRCGADCPSACSGGVCSCPPANSGNLLVNGGFETNVASWTPAPGDEVDLLWQSKDAASACTSSPFGSMVIRNRKPGTGGATISQCVAVARPLSLSAGASFYLPSAGNVAGTAGVQVGWYSAAGCPANALIQQDAMTLTNPAPDRWNPVVEPLSAIPPQAISARFQILAGKQSPDGVFELWVDRAYLASGGF